MKTRSLRNDSMADVLDSDIFSLLDSEPRRANEPPKIAGSSTPLASKIFGLQNDFSSSPFRKLSRSIHKPLLSKLTSPPRPGALTPGRPNIPDFFATPQRDSSVVLRALRLASKQQQLTIKRLLLDRHPAVDWDADFFDLGEGVEEFFKTLPQKLPSRLPWDDQLFDDVANILAKFGAVSSPKCKSSDELTDDDTSFSKVRHTSSSVSPAMPPQKAFSVAPGSSMMTHSMTTPLRPSNVDSPLTVWATSVKRLREMRMDQVMSPTPVGKVKPVPKPMPAMGTFAEGRKGKVVKPKAKPRAKARKIQFVFADIKTIGDGAQRKSKSVCHAYSDKENIGAQRSKRASRLTSERGLRVRKNENC